MTRCTRPITVWCLLMVVEVMHGVARSLVLAPVVGDFRARQIAVFTGSLLILSMTILTIRWMRIRTVRSLMVTGGVWVALTLIFEVALGRSLGYPWERLAEDYNVLRGGLMPIGLAVMAFAPVAAARIRARPRSRLARQFRECSGH